MPRFSQLICPATQRPCPHPEECRANLCTIDVRDIPDVFAIENALAIPSLCALVDQLRKL